MNNIRDIQYQLFDVVTLVSTRYISWMSAPKGRPASPKGYWTIIAIRQDGQFVLSKDDTIIITTLQNINKIGSYNIDSVFNTVKGVNLDKLRKSTDGNENGKR